MKSDPPDGWTQHKLGDVADVAWGDTKTTKASYVQPPDGFQAFSASGPDGRLRHFDYEGEGVVLSAIGANCGRVYFARGKWSCIKNTIRLFGRSGVANSRFLYYATSVPSLWPKRGSAQPFISQSDARNMRITLPSVPEQESIASVLGALDDKIDSNRRLATSLEQTAATLFRARFVDFVGIEDFQESEMGLIPRGWRAARFSDAVEINPAVPLRKGTIAPFIEMAAVAPWGVRPNNITKRKYSGGARFQSGDTLMARITGCIEHGKGAFIDFLESPGSGSTEFLVFRAKPPLTPEAVFLFSRDDRVRSHAITNMTGSSGRQRVAKGCFEDLKIAVPPDVESWREDADFLRAAFAQSRGIWRESRSLADIRNSLVPKLISGEINVPHATDPEEIVGEAIEEVRA